MLVEFSMKIDKVVNVVYIPVHLKFYLCLFIIVVNNDFNAIKIKLIFF